MSPSWEEKRNVKNDGKEKIMLKVSLINEQLGLPGYIFIRGKEKHDGDQLIIGYVTQIHQNGFFLKISCKNIQDELN